MARTTANPTPVPRFTRWALRIGGGVAIACGAILSFFALNGLAVMNGWPQTIAWALPGSVDILTATAAVTAMSVPRRHPGARIAHWCAIASLLITVGCNVEYHALIPAHWSIGHVFLVATGAVPAIVVELILVMQMHLGDGAALIDTGSQSAPDGKKKPERQQPATGIGKAGEPPAASASGTGNQAPTLNPAAAPAIKAPKSGSGTSGEPAAALDPAATAPAAAPESGNGIVVEINGNGRRSSRDWAVLAMPYYRQHLAQNGQPPSAPKLAQLLRDAYPELPVPKSERSERNIRSEADDIAKSGEPEPERDMEVAS